MAPSPTARGGRRAGPDATPGDLDRPCAGPDAAGSDEGARADPADGLGPRADLDAGPEVPGPDPAVVPGA
ncbi:hypothetical protein, partial [Aquipuribacter hungaricus]|uniref:hypothetical protein n=1 Tax=Aquipuribacter hungaricus TaxID=545624 RepID=UPI0030ED4FBA